MQRSNPSEFLGFAGRVALIHTVTYFLFGLIMSNLFEYGRLFQQEIIRDFMRPIGSPYIILGPLLQPIRGLLFAVGLWPLRRIILESKHGWLILWSIFVVFGILGTPAAAPSSLEGIIYSKLPFWYHLIGLPEILLQTLTFSLLLLQWEKRRDQPDTFLQKNLVGPNIVKAVMIATFAYMGYAAGSILSAIVAKVNIDFESAASDWKTQLMFVVAFVMNIFLVYFTSKKWIKREIVLWHIFAFFWLADTAILLIYQLIFLSPMPLPFALLVGFFPALVITLGVKLSDKR